MATKIPRLSAQPLLAPTTFSASDTIVAGRADGGVVCTSTSQHGVVENRVAQVGSAKIRTTQVGSLQVGGAEGSPR